MLTSANRVHGACLPSPECGIREKETSVYLSWCLIFNYFYMGYKLHYDQEPKPEYILTQLFGKI